MIITNYKIEIHNILCLNLYQYSISRHSPIFILLSSFSLSLFSHLGNRISESNSSHTDRLYIYILYWLVSVKVIWLWLLRMNSLQLRGVSRVIYKLMSSDTSARGNLVDQVLFWFIRGCWSTAGYCMVGFGWSAEEREKMRSGNDAPKLIVEALLQRFLPLARRRIDTAQAQVLSFLKSPIGFKFKASINFGLQLLKAKTLV